MGIYIFTGWVMHLKVSRSQESESRRIRLIRELFVWFLFCLLNSDFLILDTPKSLIFSGEAL